MYAQLFKEIFDKNLEDMNKLIIKDFTKLVNHVTEDFGLATPQRILDTILGVAHLHGDEKAGTITDIQ